MIYVFGIYDVGNSEFFTPLSATLKKTFLLLPLAISDGQIIGNGQRVCNNFEIQEIVS